MRSGMWGSERRFCILYLQAKEIQDRGPARRTATQCTRRSQDTRARRQSDPAAQRGAKLAASRARGVARHTHP